jgi:hypothetical protein
MSRKKLLSIITPIALACAVASNVAQAATIALFDYGFNIDGTVSVPFQGDPVPSGVNLSGFDDITGLGAIGVTMTGAGAHSFDAFFDHEIDEAINTFFNETGAATGTALAGQSWEIDEPGDSNGDIFVNFQDSALDNGIGTSVFGNTIFPDDVSMAMGWDFSLASGNMAFIELILSELEPTSGFFLSHSDPDSNATIYLSSTLTVTAIPVPAAVWLFGSGLLGLIGIAGRKCANL